MMKVWNRREFICCLNQHFKKIAHRLNGGSRSNVSLIIVIWKLDVSSFSPPFKRWESKQCFINNCDLEIGYVSPPFKRWANKKTTGSDSGG
jgi:hypothetical protein